MSSEEDDPTVLKYGPNITLQIVGLIIFVIGMFFTFIFLGNLYPIVAVDVTLLFKNPLVFLISLLPAIIGLSWGYWWMTSGGVGLTFTPRMFIHRRFFGRDEFKWPELNDRFELVVRSSQPEVKGRKGSEAWDVEMRYKAKDKTKTTTVSFPEIKNGFDVTRLFRGLQEKINAVPKDKRIETSMLVGQTQTIVFEIRRKSVRELQKEQSQGKRPRRRK